MSSGIVIVGGGQAACQLAASLRQMGYAGILKMFTEEHHLPYQRPPLSKDFLKSTSSSDVVQLRPASFYSSIGCEARTGLHVVRIDRDRKLLELTNGETVPYGKLVLATGARARTLSSAQSNGVSIHYLRTADDANALRKTLGSAQQLAIIGAGYVGMEVAASAVQRGIAVSVFEAATRVMQRSVGPHISGVVQALHAEHGVRLHLGSSIKSIRPGTSGSAGIVIESSQTGTFEADALVVGIGADPNMELAAQAGLDCGRAIRVDANCQTSDPEIFAIGDCTEQTQSPYGVDLRLESVQNAIDQAKCAAAVLAGKPAPASAVPWFWSDQYDHRIQVAGVSLPSDEVLVRPCVSKDGASLRQSVWYLRGNRVAAVETIDAPEEFMVAKMLIKNACQVAPKRLADTSLPVQALLQAV